MPVNNPDRAFFWDATNKSWRAAQVGDPGEYVWNDTTKSWQFGDIGAEYKWNRTTRAWEPGPGGQYVYNHSTKSWDKVTSPGYGGQYYWDTTTNSWTRNANAASASDAFARWDFLTNQAWWDGAYVGALANTPNWTASPATHSGGLSTYALKSDGTLQAFASGTLRRTDKGVLIEGARTNLCLRSNDWTNAAWTKTDVTATKDQTGPDGVANSATRLTATGANGTALQSITSASANRYGSVWIKRITGSGNIDVTLDGGTSWTTISVTSSWQRLGKAQTSVTNPNFGLRIVTSGDEVAVMFGQVESADFPSSPIPTTTASATRAADSLTVTGVTGLDYPLTPFAEWERGVDTGGSENVMCLHTGNGNELALLGVDSTDLLRLFVNNGGVTQANAIVAGATAVATAYKAAGRVTTNNQIAARSGTLSTADTTCSVPSAPTTIQFGAQNGGGSPLFGYLRRAAIYASAKTDAQLQAMTA